MTMKNSPMQRNRTKITTSGQCKNSPKNQALESIALALLTADGSEVSNWLCGDTHWYLETGELLIGEKILPHLNGHNVPETIEVTHVITHGKSGAVNTLLVSKAGKFRRCDLIEFSTVKMNKIAKIMTYISPVLD